MSEKEAAESSEADKNGFDGLAEGPSLDKPMSFFDHVAELRSRLFRIVIAVGLGFAISFAFSRQLTAFLRGPLDDAWRSSGLEGLPTLQALSMQDTLMVDFRVALTGGIFLSLPLIFYQLWAFVSPGLYREEKRFVIPFVVVSAAMFTLGATLRLHLRHPLHLPILHRVRDGSRDLGPAGAEQLL